MRNATARTATALIVILMITLPTCTSKPEPESLTFFYLPLCPTCPETIAIEVLMGRIAQLDRDNEHISVTFQDMRNRESAQRLREFAAERDLAPASFATPTLFVNDRVYDGFSEVERYLESR